MVVTCHLLNERFHDGEYPVTEHHRHVCDALEESSMKLPVPLTWRRVVEEGRGMRGGRPISLNIFEHRKYRKSNNSILDVVAVIHKTSLVMF